MTKTNEDVSEQIRRRELREQLAVVPPNTRFASYTTSTAFSLSLSRSMIVALQLLEQAIDEQLPIGRFPIGDSGTNGLERRGLIERWASPGAKSWADIVRITRAGQLVLDLLAEAQLIEARVLRRPLPPPPPGWLDPRPKLVLTPDGAHLAPSEREAAAAAGEES